MSWSSTPAPAPPAAGAPQRRRTRSPRAGCSSSPPPPGQRWSRRSRYSESCDERRDRSPRQAPADDQDAAKWPRQLRERIAAQFGRSLHIRTLDTGSCAVCEQEIRLLSRTPLRPAPARLLLHPRAQARRPAAGHRADGAGLRRGGAQDLRGDARAQGGGRDRRVRAGRRVPAGPVRARRGRRGPPGRRMDSGLPAQPASPAAGARRGGGPARGEDTRPDVHRR